MKTCSKCKVAKPEAAFFLKDKSKNRLHAQCKSCYALQRKKHYKQHYQRYRDKYISRAKLRREALRKEFRENMLAYLTNKACVECGEDDLRVLEFAHIDPQTKLFGISRAVQLGHSWEIVLQEIAKCRILCANCHKKETAEQFGWYKTTGGTDRI